MSTRFEELTELAQVRKKLIVRLQHNVRELEAMLETATVANKPEEVINYVSEALEDERRQLEKELQKYRVANDVPPADDTKVASSNESL